ncbi:Os09g0354600 [Oryza sativa Japonica Group]|uniref:Os09g0354600 protein n=1 Tax=Oryza sativa subsp. japonica TaxID=39947 RepID=A0A0P0XKJ4_ORYSJ|nr:Os09g0354600 [Oryza sativa Japonica Group]
MGYYSDDHIRVPRDVLRTAITTSATSVHLNITVHAASVGQLPPPTERAYFHFLHFASFEQQQRQFEIYSGKVKWKKQNNISVYELYSMQPSYSSSGLYMLSNVSLVATNDSVLPPLLNAIEIYYSIPHDDTITSPDDVDAIMAIKTQYQVKKNWMGDPCLPKESIWTGLQCLVHQYSVQPTGISNSVSHVDIKGHVLMSDDHEFTYEELVKITNNFSECIGEGGFGPVYLGKKANVQTMSWLQRARIVHEAAQGCVLPIIHRDVKSHNILLGEDMHAKISDFGLSKSYINEAQTHISVTAAGTIGYIDPEYYFSSRLTMRSDVFSFGVVLLETVTGEPPIVPGVGHVVQRVKQKVSDGDISAIVDPRLEDAYDIGSVWKVVDIALLCTREVSDDRPTMTEVVEQLKHALALEEARHIDGHRDNGQGSIKPDLSANWGPLAR